MSRVPVAYQLYSARDAFAENPEAVLRELAHIGYDGVELAGLNGMTAGALRGLLDTYGLTAISAHVPLAAMQRDLETVITDYGILGCRYLAVPRLDTDERPGGIGFGRTLGQLQRFGIRLRQAGMTLLFHNHFCEFEPVSGQPGLDFMYDAVSEEALGTQLDVCWITYAGEDPIAYLRKYCGRCPVVHLKDFIFEKGDISPYEWETLPASAQKDARVFSFCPWGAGNLDTAAIMQSSIESGAEWFVIEQDDPWQGTPLENAAQSMETIKRVYRQLSL